ncbi:MAG: FadR family transcriptional regulator [Synergistaceae bacterium]|nr:FadR family transcriptional regulator [Synergistaceae bacterium]
MELTPIKRVVVHDTILNLIKEYILSNKLNPGNKLPSERDLAQTLDVSRNSIREALKSMQSQGYIHISHGAGTYVSDISGLIVEKQVFDGRVLEKLLQIREMVEPYAVGLLSMQHPCPDYSELETLLLREAEKNKAEDISDLPNLNFEVELVRLTENTLLYGFYFNISLAWKEFWKKNGSTVLNAAARHKEHINIFNAIKKGQTDKAVKLAKEHLKGVKLILK